MSAVFFLPNLTRASEEWRTGLFELDSSQPSESFKLAFLSLAIAVLAGIVALLSFPLDIWVTGLFTDVHFWLRFVV